MVVVKTRIKGDDRVFRLADDSAPTLDVAEDLVLSLLKIHYCLQEIWLDYVGGWEWDIKRGKAWLGKAYVLHRPGSPVLPSVVHLVVCALVV